MSDTWYNSPAWDTLAQADFRGRLSRAKHQKAYYLRMKAAALANEFPEAALGLCDERIALGKALGEEDQCYGAAYAKTLIHLQTGRLDDAFASLEDAIGVDGLALGAPAAGEYCCLVGFHGRTDLFPRAIGILDALDAMAQRERGRPFASFPTRAGRALIEYRSGRKTAAVEPAKEALELALSQSVPILGVGKLGPAPRFPSPITDALVVIAGLWNEAELGSAPDV